MKDGKESQKTWIVEVIPISKGVARPSLSYFSLAKPELGQLVKIDIRGRETRGFVARVEPAQDQKSSLKEQSFALKKLLKKNISSAGLPSPFVRAVDKTARFYASTLGPALSLLLPKILLDESEKFFITKNIQTEKELRNIISKETTVLQTDSLERYGHYRALVRQYFAREKSVMFVVPTHEEVLRAKESLSRGIEDFTYCFSLKMKKKELTSSWITARDSKHSVLFITTPAGLSWSRRDLEVMVLERENSRVYQTFSRPYINTKSFAKYLAYEWRRQLILGDSVLSVETIKKLKDGEYGELSPARWRLEARPITLVDAKSKSREDGSFEIFSEELKEFIKRAHLEKKSLFIYAQRKGLAPTTACGDCGSLLSCTNCGAPVVLHSGNGESFYSCHACGKRRDPKTLCDHCGSWKLTPLGIGSETIAKRVRELIGGQAVLILDKEHAETETKAKTLANHFLKNGGVLIGTELAFSFVPHADYTAAVSLEPLFSIPDFGIHERIFYLVTHLREMASIESLVQTKNVGREILIRASQGNIIDFYQDEIYERNSLLYPPFSIFIKVSVQIRERELAEEKEKLEAYFKEWQPEIMTTKTKKSGILELSFIIRKLREEWPEEKLVTKLSLLGPQFLIKVDPESIL